MSALAGAIHRTVPLRAPDFQPDLAELRAAVTDRTRVILVNNPHNPTGAVFAREVLEEIVRLAHRHDAPSSPTRCTSTSSSGSGTCRSPTLAGAWERTLTISSAGKTFSYTGWKVGWAPARNRWSPRCAPSSSSSATVPARRSSRPSPQPWRCRTSSTPGFAAALQAKRDLLCAGLEAAGLGVFRPSGTYFAVTDTAPLGFTDAAALARAMPAAVGVAGIPVSVFCHPEGAERTRSLLRFAFCKREDVLREASARLAGLPELRPAGTP